jgi:hypothetical protein
LHLLLNVMTWVGLHNDQAGKVQDCKSKEIHVLIGVFAILVRWLHFRFGKIAGRKLSFVVEFKS